ncbi:AAA family ATPase [Corynebacterium mastitidis]
MIIHKIELKNVRGVKYFRIADLVMGGVNVIYGDNEEGKSTIVDAINVALTAPSSSKALNSRKKDEITPFGAAWLKSVDSDESPEVTLELTVGPYRFELYKRWFKGNRTELTIAEPKRENLTAQEAENRLQGILGEHLDKILLKTLFLRQTDMNDAVAAAGLPTLEGALRAATGAGAQGLDGDTVLMRRVEEEYLKYFTKKTGNPSKEYSEAQKRLAAAQESFESAEEAMRKLEGYLDDYEKATAKRERARDELPEAKAEEEEKRALAEEADRAKAETERRREELERAHLELQQAQKEKARRDRLRAEIEEASARVAEAAENVSHCEADAAEEEKIFREISARIEKLQDSHAQARAKYEEQRAVVDRAEAREKKKKLAEQVDSIEALERAVQQAQEAAAARGRVIGDRDVRAVEEAATEVEIAKALRDQAAAKLIFHAAAGSEITVNGVARMLPAGEEISVPLEEGTALGIGAVTARFEAGNAGTNQIHERMERAQDALDSLLRELDCSGKEEVRLRREEHRAIEERLDRARRDLEAELRGNDPTALRAELKALTERLAGEPAEEKLSVQDSKRQRDHWEEKASELHADLERARGQLVSVQERPGRSALIVAQQEHKSAVDQEKRAVAALDKEEQAQPTEEILAAVKAAEERVEHVNLAVARIQKEWADRDPDEVIRLYEGAQSRVAQIEERAAAAERQIFSLRSYIEAAQGAAEDYSLAASELDAARSAHDSVERRALAARRLRTVMSRHRDEARQRYAKPFADRLSALASSLYQEEVFFDLNEQLEVVSRTHSNVTVKMEDLSGGAREQLAILTRFAIADMVEKGAGQSGAPILVDDALGSTDARRLERMSMLFADAGNRNQVIVLTCMPERYDRISGCAMFDIADLKKTTA